jgi:hypothetical protein
MIGKTIHDAPWLTVRDQEVLFRFCDRFGITSGVHADKILMMVTEAFKCVPYENLTKILKADSVISASSAMRYPDEVLKDYLKFGSGGTCFSLTAAVIGVLDSMGIEAYPVLADRHYGADTHCGIMLPKPNGVFLLLDPGYLLFAPVEIPKQHPISFETGFNTVELRPSCAGTRIELHTLVKGNRKHRLTFKLEPVSDDAFGGAWERSFAFEMMTYPVYTRQVNGCHQYLQGNVLAIRDAHRTQRMTLTPDRQIKFIETAAGINREIVIRALEIVGYGCTKNAGGISRDSI